MAKDKRSFLLYSDFLHTVEKLSDEEAGKLIKHLMRYVNDLYPEPPDRLTEITFEPIKHQLKRDLKNWEELRERRREYGKIGGVAKASINKQKLAKATKSLANVAVNVNANVNVIDKENFELFRKTFPGKKNGLVVEFDNFTKKHSDWAECLPKLLTAVNDEIQDRENRASKNQFNPEWKNLKTWINNRCWEQEFEAATGKERIKSHPAYDFRMQSQLEQSALLQIRLSDKLLDYKRATGQ